MWIGKVEIYHIPVHRIYDIIEAKIQGIISKNAMIQMAFKAVNNIAGPNSLVHTLFVFSANPCIVMDLPPSFSKQQWANTMAKAMSKLHKLKTRRGVQDVLNAYNDPNTIQTLLLALNLDGKVRIYQKKKDK